MSVTTGRGWVALLAAVAMALAMLPAMTVAADEHEGADPEDWEVFDQTVLIDDPGEPMAIAVLPDGRVLQNDRSDDPGEDGNDAVSPIRLYDPETGEAPIIAELPVYSFSEYGGQGMALDPDFEDNGWVYIYYTPVHPDVPSGEAPHDSEDPSVWDDYQGHNNLSRFQFVDGDEPTLDLDSEQVLLEVPQNLGLCCHLGGDLDFDSQGNLYLATGDDTSPFESDNFTPIDVRETRNPGFDAQRTSANTASLNGKLLRITPQEDGSYTVPEDNMFVSGAYDELFPDGVYDEELALPEIYAMGFRNPFRFSVDPVTDNVYLGDYGPDAAEADPERGPQATVSWHIISEPANIGWPYCIGNNFPFVDYDFATGESGETFDCDNPVNDSPYNTGLTELPPTRPADVWDFNNALPDEFPELEVRGGAPMGGPVYRYDEDLDSDIKFPEFYDGTAFFYEWNADYIRQFVLNEDGTSLEEIREFLPDMDFNNPMDMEFGPDGAMYLLEYGGGFFVEHEDAQLSRITFGPDTTGVDPVDPVDPPEGTVCERHQGGATFPDAPGSGHRFFIDCLAELGIVQGYTDGTFGPRDDVSRGQLASFVVRAIELSTGETMESGGQLFPDVGVNSTHGEAIYKLRNAGIIRGFEDGTFRARASVSRDQTARYVVNALEYVTGDELERSGASFPDVAAGSQYASDIDALATAGVITGFPDGTFGPREPVTRAQMTRFIGNALHVLDDAGVYEGP